MLRKLVNFTIQQNRNTQQGFCTNKNFQKFLEKNIGDSNEMKQIVPTHLEKGESLNNIYCNLCKFEHEDNNYAALALIQEVFLENKIAKEAPMEQVVVNYEHDEADDEVISYYQDCEEPSHTCTQGLAVVTRAQSRAQNQMQL